MPSAEQLRNELRLDHDEDPDDVLMMIDILARERQRTLRIPASLKDHRLAGKIICVILDPVKTSVYLETARIFRRRFDGISKSKSTQEVFKKSLDPTVLGVRSIDDAVLQGFQQLFRKLEDTTTA